MNRFSVRAFLLLSGTLLVSAQGLTAQAAGEEEEADAPTTYADVITAETVTDEGLFDVHRQDGNLFYEIPLEMLGREMLLLTRFDQTPDGAGYGGSKLNTSHVRWQRRDDKILLRLVSYDNVADEGLPIAEAVANSNAQPIVAAFDIEVMNDDSTAVVIDVTDLFMKDTPILGITGRRREQLEIRSLDEDRTFIDGALAFPRNVEVRRTVTYISLDPPSNDAMGSFTAQLHHSMLLLPDDPMQPRKCDPRVGFFSVDRVNFGLDTQRATEECFVTRWRLEPSDPDAYMRGELVDPVEPIVYYIDAATPEKWRPWLKQGVEDWQVAFEAAGFSNAIIAADPPTDDPTWHPEDARYSVIRYLASGVQNASGPHVHDPRTGHILESDIQWYHNVMNLVRNWYLIQTAAANPEARGVEFDDAVMGELIRFVSAHEVGHTLGLQHNMQSSAAYPVEQLRTDFVCEFGVAPSIMDYARFNYVAQPGDDTCFMPKVGPYDLFAIEWGYRWFPDESTDSERATLNAMVAEMQEDPIYRFSSPNGEDPTAQTEAIGDDAMRASDYGIANLQRIVASLREWTYEEGEDYDQLEELHGQVFGQWNRYSGHVLTTVGGVVTHRKRQGQEGPQFEPVPADDQARAVDYLNRQVFETPEWMLDEEILGVIRGSGVPDQIRGGQVSALNRLLDVDRMKRLIEQEAFLGDDAYSLGEMLADVREGVWREAYEGDDTDAFRRNLQRGYLDRMAALMEDEDARVTDIVAFVRGELGSLRETLTGAADSTGDRATELHYRDVVARIDDLLDT
ncbi:MAG: zinc-dependent metalloprotease [Longimicrobiales bacterium]|nr:zinc-dependent metalloprotease [Longimicrobiales bacterium]